MDDPMPEPDPPELPELLWRVEKMIEHCESTCRVLLTLSDYLPPGFLQRDALLHRAFEHLREILEPAGSGPKAGDASCFGGYPASPSSQG